MSMIKVSTWGNVKIGDFRVRVPDYDVIGSVRRSIERRTGLRVVTCYVDGCSMNAGKLESRHYQMTLGRPLPRKTGGGYSVSGQVWVAIPV